MNNNLFLKKYKNSCELVTKEGPLGILNHLHYNIIGFKPKAKKKKKPPPKKPEPDYSYVTSIVKYDFNQNKNFVPQLSNLLNYLKNKEMNNNIIKRRTQLKKNNNNEEKHYNFIKNDNNNNDDAFNTKIIRKKLKFKTDNEKQNYINLDKLTEQNTLKFKNKRIQNQIVNKSQSMTSNNDINSYIYIFDKNSNKILPLINHSQDMNNYLKISKMNNNSKKKYFTPLINRQSRIYDKNKIRKFHFNKEMINNEILIKSNSTMNIYRKNNDDINIENNYIYNENNNDKINNLFSKEIAENKNNEEIKERNLNMIKQRINKFNELKIKNNQIEDNHKYLNIIDEEEEDENSKNSNVNNNKNLNLLQILMKQRQQYFKNIENSIKYQNAMPMDF